MINILKLFSIVREAEIDVFLKFSCFFCDPTEVAIWFLVILPFLHSACISGSSWFMYCWSLAWRILSITLLTCEMTAVVQQFEYSLAFPFFGTWMKTTLFQSYGKRQCWRFQICWHIECSTLTASSFRIWNSSAEIPSPTLALFVELLQPENKPV